MKKALLLANSITASGVADASTLVSSPIQDVAEKYATGGGRETSDKRQQDRRTSSAISTKQPTLLATWNIRTGHAVGHREQVAKELGNYNISVAALTELRMTRSGNTTVISPANNAKYELYYSGGTKHIEGVGFMVGSSFNKYVTGFNPISSRMAVLTLHGIINMNLVVVYAPTEVSPETAKDEFYDNLQMVWDSLPRSNINILLGDLNAHTGRDSHAWPDVLGPFGVGSINDNGTRFLSFASLNGLRIGNSLFRHPPRHQLTWRSANGRDRACIDYVAISRRFQTSLQDVRDMRGADCGSDHHLVRIKIRLRLKRPATNNKREQKPNVALLRDPAVQEKYQITLKNRFEALTTSEADESQEGVDRLANELANAITDSTKEVCPSTKRHVQPWISEKTLFLIDKRKKCKLNNQPEYRRLNKLVRVHLKEDRAVYWENLAKDMEGAANRNEFRTLYSTIRRLSGKSRPLENNIKDKTGKFISSNTGRLDVGRTSSAPSSTTMPHLERWNRWMPWTSCLRKSMSPNRL